MTKEIEELCQEAADAASLNAVLVLSQWLDDKGFPDLSKQMKAEWLINIEEPDEQPELSADINDMHPNED